MSLTLFAGQVAAAARRLVAGRPWIRWLPSLAFAACFVPAVHAHQARLDEQVRAWGDTIEVWVADTDHSPGEPVRATLRRVPVAIAPDAAIDRVMVDARVRQHVGAGEIVTDADVTRSGPLGIVPEGWRAVPVRERPASGAAVGDRVGIATEGIVLVDDGIVVDRFDDVTLVGVPVAAAPLVAMADAAGVTLLRAP